MNLRDLIFTQTKSTAESPVLNNFFGSPAQSSCEASFDDRYSNLVHSDSDESKIDEDFNDNETEERLLSRSKYLGHYPIHVNKKQRLYLESPEIAFQNSLKFDGHMQQFAPGISGYVRYPPIERSVLSHHRSLVRHIWNLCYFSKDFEGSTMAIKLLSEIDSVEMPDLVMLAELTRLSDSSVATRTLVQHSIKRRLVKKNTGTRTSLLGMFVELLVAQKDVVSARRLLQGRIADPAFSGSEYLLGLDSIVVCNQVTDLASSLCGGSLPLPEVQDIAVDPLEFFHFVRVVHLAAAGDLAQTSDSSSEKAISSTARLQCRQLLNELKMSFMKSGVASDGKGGGRKTCLWVDLHGLYVAFLEGTRQHRAAEQHMAVVISIFGEFGHNNVSAEEKCQEQLAIRCFRFTLQYLARFVMPVGSDGRVLDSDETRSLLTYLHRQLLTTDCSEPQDVFCALQLRRMGLLSSERLLQLVCDAIESSPPCSSSDDPAVFTTYQWLLWRLVAALLGPLPLLAPIHAPISEDSDLSAHLHSQKSVQLGVSKEGVDRERSSFMRHRGWWTGSILAAAQLGAECSDSVREFEVLDILDPQTKDVAGVNDGANGDDELLAISALMLNLLLPADCGSWHDFTLGLLNSSSNLMGLSQDARGLLGGENLDDISGRDRHEDEELSLHSFLQSSNHSVSFDWDSMTLPLDDDRTRQLVADVVRLLGRSCGSLLGTIDATRDSLGFDFSSTPEQYLFLPESSLGGQHLSAEFGAQFSSFQKLGQHAIDVLRCQTMVHCHLRAGSQDSLFVAKAVQMLSENALHHTDPVTKLSAVKCLQELRHANVNVLRAVRIASVLASHDVCTYVSPSGLSGGIRHQTNSTYEAV